MVFKRANAAGVQRKGINKLTLGFASLAAAAVIGTTGVAAAQTMSSPDQSGSGYGNDHNTTNVELNVHQSGSHNVLNIVLNLFQ
jgi:hypothetical protein